MNIPFKTCPDHVRITKNPEPSSGLGVLFGGFLSYAVSNPVPGI